MAMEALSGRLRREHRTLVCMTGIYCKDHHAAHRPAGRGALCEECADLMRYAERRLAKCPYGQAKPTCAKCPIHCYKRDPRERVRQIMIYAGPRMTLRHPVRSLVHVFDKLRKAMHPRELRRLRRSG